MASPAGSPAKAVQYKHKLQTTERTEGKHWNAEVIRALCRRLPGGHTSVTTKCEECKSIFYPCLCKADNKRENHIPHNRVLKAPRIVRVAEKSFLQIGKHKGPRGNLALVRKDVHKNGLNRHRACITPFDDPTDIRYDEFKGKVKYRFGGNYAIEPDKASAWCQLVSLAENDWSRVADVLDEECRVVRDLPEDVVVHEVAYEDEATLINNFKVSWMRDAFYVQLVTPGSHAYTCGVREGQQLKTLEFFHSETWLKLDPKKHLPEECIHTHSHNKLERSDKLERSTRSKDEEIPGWPIKFRFNALPSGWRIVRIKGCPEEYMSKEFLMEKAADLYQGKDDGEALCFEAEAVPVKMVARTELQLRHEFYRERNVKSTPDRDVKLLVDWGIKSKLTPAQLQFTFKKLQESVEAELDSFEDLRRENERVMLHKCRRIKEIEYDLKSLQEEACHRKKESRPIDSALKLKMETLSKENSTLENDLENILNGVPIHFLEEIRQACDPKYYIKFGQSLSRHHSTSSMSPAKSLTRSARSLDKSVNDFDFPNSCGENDDRSVSQLRQRFTTGILMTTTSYHKATHTRFRNRTRSGGKTVGEEDVLNCVYERVVEYFKHRDSDRVLEQQRMQAMKRHDAGRRKTTRSSTSSDGRMSPEEFEKAMYMAGISWLTCEELRQLFDDMDADKSGRLHLGEILEVATRMQDISREARAYEITEVADKNRVMNQQELLEEFCTVKLIGHDLTNSTYIKLRSVCTSDAPGRVLSPDEMRDLHYESIDSAFHLEWNRPAGSEGGAWVQFDLPDRCTISAVSTRGDSKNASWIQTYKIFYKKPLDPHEPVGGRCEKGHKLELASKPHEFLCHQCKTDERGNHWNCEQCSQDWCFRCRHENKAEAEIRKREAISSAEFHLQEAICRQNEANDAAAKHKKDVFETADAAAKDARQKADALARTIQSIDEDIKAKEDEVHWTEYKDSHGHALLDGNNDAGMGNLERLEPTIMACTHVRIVVEEAKRHGRNGCVGFHLAMYGFRLDAEGNRISDRDPALDRKTVRSFKASGNAVRLTAQSGPKPRPSINQLLPPREH